MPLGTLRIAKPLAHIKTNEMNRKELENQIKIDIDRINTGNLSPEELIQVFINAANGFNDLNLSEFKNEFQQLLIEHEVKYQLNVIKTTIKLLHNNNSIALKDGGIYTVSVLESILRYISV